MTLDDAMDTNAIQEMDNLVVHPWDNLQDAGRNRRTIIEKAQRAEIPLVLFNKEATEAGVMQIYDQVWYVGTNSAESGIIQGEMMVADWQANPEWDRNGEISVYDKEGRKWGIVPFITSYRTECYWQVDVTHFRPLLAGKTRFEVRAGTTFYKNRGYMMSVSLDFYHGKPPLEPYRSLSRRLLTSFLTPTSVTNSLFVKCLKGASRTSLA